MLLKKYIIGISTLLLFHPLSVIADNIHVLERQMRQLRQTVLEQSFKMSQQQRTLQNLQGQIEVLNYQLKLVKKSQNNILFDLEELQKSPPLDVIVSPAQLPVGDANQAFQQILDLLKNDDYETALTALKDFLKRYPQREEADDAQYWLGEVYYIQKQFDLALPAFSALLEQYPNSPKHSQALLKIAYIYTEQNDYDTATAILQQIQEIYPGTAVSRLAEQRLQEISEDK